MGRRDLGNYITPVREDGVVTAKGLIARATTPAVAGGDTTPLLAGGTVTSTVGIYWGSGVPTITAAQGSLYLRSDGSSVSTRLYVNTTGSNVWTNVTTGA